MNSNVLICFDFETTGLNIERLEPLEIAAQAYDPNTLEPYSKADGGRFSSLMKPPDITSLDTPEAARAQIIHRIPREQILAAPDQKVVWNEFIKWVAKWNPKKGARTAPIACGKNIRSFDLPIAMRLNKQHHKKGEDVVLFNEKDVVDLDDVWWLWFEHETEPKDRKMDTLRVWLQLDQAASHRADFDVEQEGGLIMKFLKLHRRLRQEVNQQTGEKRIRFQKVAA